MTIIEMIPDKSEQRLGFQQITRRLPGHFRLNLGCIDGIDSLALEYDLFDRKTRRCTFSLQ
jgi:hypothetical protein